jgi:multidrug transporter EmrE-like cation transporter
MYARYMAIAFLANGLGVFGLRILAGWGLGDKYSVQYLGLWYLSGSVIAALAYLRSHRMPYAREMVIGGAMAFCSLLGQLGIALALSHQFPGFVVFPVAIGGGLLLVVVVGVKAFKEKLSLSGYLGIGVGVIALILLALP